MKLRDIDYGALDDIAYSIGQDLRFWRVSVRDTKEKHGTVRVYCSFGIDSLHTLVYPGYAYNQFPDWLRKLDARVISPFLYKSGLGSLTARLHTKVYAKVYKKYMDRYPQYARNILAGADYRELLEYNRMNPELSELITRLEEYQAKDYGTEAYPLSRAEAQLILTKIK